MVTEMSKTKLLILFFHFALLTMILACQSESEKPVISYELKEELKQNKWVKVTVTLIEINSSLRDEVIASLGPDEFNVTRSGNSGGWFTGFITKKGLDKIRSDPRVKSVYLPQPLKIQTDFTLNNSSEVPLEQDYRFDSLIITFNGKELNQINASSNDLSFRDDFSKEINEINIQLEYMEDIHIKWYSTFNGVNLRLKYPEGLSSLAQKENLETLKTILSRQWYTQNVQYDLLESTDNTSPNNLLIEKYCDRDQDCVPASCCHSIECINTKLKPNCEGIDCTDVDLPDRAYGPDDCLCKSNFCINQNR